jgi:Family of unknown function (DUF5719)
MNPAHQSPERRWRVLAAVAIVIAAVAVVAATRSSAPAAAQAVPGALVSAPNAESSAWYCAGQSTGAVGVADGTILLSNTTTRAATGTITVVSDSRSSVLKAVAIPARGQVIPTLAPPASGSWVADIVTISGGGVDVSQLVHGASGWSVSPCLSTTSATWYFPMGSTAASDGVGISLLNPTSTPVVVDLSFVTPSGTVHPINYQGIVLRPDQLQVEDVANEVQNQSSVATVVQARTGRLVAAQVQTFIGPQAGLSVVPGLPNLESDWFIPQSQELSGGTGLISVFNPGDTTEDVTVQLRLASGPLAPLTDHVQPGTAWILSTSAQTRIPRGDLYSAAITASGGPGVVVGRAVAAPSSAGAPQAGLGNAIDELSTMSPTGLWIVPPPGTKSAPVVTGAQPYQLALQNTSGSSASYTVYAVSPAGTRKIASGSVGADAFALVGGTTLAKAGFDQLIVRSSEPAAVAEDMAPTGNYGVVAVPGVPLAAPIPL